MANQTFGPGKILKGFQSLIHDEAGEANPPATAEEHTPTLQPSEEQSSFSTNNKKQRELTGEKPRVLPQTWRNSKD